MKETRSQVVDALIAHVIALSAGKPVIEDAAPGLNICFATAGDFRISRASPNHWAAQEIVDIWNGKKVFSASRSRDGDWEVRSFKRGDWEVGFLLTEAAHV